MTQPSVNCDEHLARELLIEDLRARNMEILEAEQAIERMMNYGILALAALLGFVGSGGLQSHADLTSLFYSTGSLLFLGLTLKVLYYQHFICTVGEYIETVLLDQLHEQCDDPERLYGWERFIMRRHVKTLPPPLARGVEALLTLGPGLYLLYRGFEALGSAATAHRVASWVLFVLCCVVSISIILAACSVLRLVRRRAKRIRVDSPPGGSRDPSKARRHERVARSQ